MNKLKNKLVLLPFFMASISLVLLLIFNIFQPNINERKYLSFENDIKNKNIELVYFTNEPYIDVKLTNGTIYKTENPRITTFKEDLLKDGVSVSESPLYTIPTITLAIIFVSSTAILLFMLIKKNPRRSKALFSVDSIDLTPIEKNHMNFDAMAGNEEAKESVKDLVDFLKSPEKYNFYGARMPKGVILYGEPGTGKTLLAKAVAGEAGVPFYAMSGSDFIQVYVGVGASRIRQLFKKARSHGKAVIFIDEIDAIGKHRDGGKNGGSDERDQTLNALLTEMSGFNDKEGIIVIAATNRLDMLDSALLRPGRFDRHIEITLPDINARKNIIKLHLENKPTKNINIDSLAQKTAYFSGAKLESLVNEAAILACKNSSEFIDDSHLDMAYSIVVAGHEKIDRSNIRSIDKCITAYHEAGHALLSLKLLPEEVVSKVTIIPSTKGAGGYTMSIPQDNQYQNKDYIKRRIMILLAGRAAEDLIFGSDYITTGAYGDLKESTKMVTNMLTSFGMGKSLGLLTLAELSSINYTADSNIINEGKEILNSLYNDAKKTLSENMKSLEKLADELLVKETIHYDDILNIVEN